RGRCGDMRRFGWVALAICLMLATATSTQAEKRLALLIGSPSYITEIGRLFNPHNEITLLEGVLTRLGVDVTTVSDARLASLPQAVNTHVRRIRHLIAASPSFSILTAAEISLPMHGTFKADGSHSLVWQADASGLFVPQVSREQIGSL